MQKHHRWKQSDGKVALDTVQSRRYTPPPCSLTTAGMSCGKHQRRTCSNCGQQGHMHRLCQEPVASFGVICCRVRNSSLEYLMVQRKDSMSYVEFVRGKYNLYNRKYIMRMFSSMTLEERERIVNWPFDDIWTHFWQNDDKRSYTKDHRHSRARFYRLREGVLINHRNGENEFFNTQIGMDATTMSYCDMTDFGFPKGRKNVNESDIKCALREFSEETGVHCSMIELLPNAAPIEEEFVGSNNVRYRHSYFIAHLKTDHNTTFANMPSNVAVPVSESNCMQMREIKSIGWFDAKNVIDRIREQYQERRSMFHDLNINLEQAASEPDQAETQQAASIRRSIDCMVAPIPRVVVRSWADNQSVIHTYSNHNAFV